MYLFREFALETLAHFIYCQWRSFISYGKNCEGNIDVFMLSDVSRKMLKGFLKNINQPHTLGTDAKEKFFGWGSGGSSNIIKSATILKDIGYQKVVAIFDGDKPKVNKEAKEG